MAKTKSYIKVAEETLVNGENWQEVYDELKGINPEQMQERIQVIDTETKKMESEIVKRQTTDRLKKDVDQATNEDTIQEMIDISTQLQGERKILEVFPKVDKKLRVISSVKRRAEKRKAEQMDKKKVAEQRLKEARAKQRELKEKLGEISEELLELQELMKTTKGKNARQAMAVTISDLQQKKEELGDKSEIDKLVADANDSVKAYRSEIKELDSVISKCEDPWNNVLKGKGWKEVANLAERDLKEMLGMPKKKEEKEVPSEEQKLDDKDQGKDEDVQVAKPSTNRTNNTNQTGNTARAVENQNIDMGIVEPPIDLNEQTYIDPFKSEYDFLEQDEEVTFDENQTYIDPFMKIDDEENKKMTRKEKKQAKREEKEKFERAFRDKYKGKPGILDKLAFKFPNLGKIFKRDFSDIYEPAKTIEEQLEEYLSKLPEDEREAKKREGEKVIAEAQKEAEELKIDVAFVEARKKLEKQIQKRKEEVEKDMGVRSIEQVQLAALTWVAEGIFSKKEVRELIEKKAKAKGKETSGEFLIPDLDEKTYNDLKERVSKQFDYLTAQEVSERAGALVALEICDKDEVKKLQEQAIEREKDREERSRQRREKLEAEAKKDKGKDGKTAKFKDRINGGKNIDTPTPLEQTGDTQVEKVEAEIVGVNRRVRAVKSTGKQSRGGER